MHYNLWAISLIKIYVFIIVGGQGEQVLLRCLGQFLPCYTVLMPPYTSNINPWWIYYYLLTVPGTLLIWRYIFIIVGHRVEQAPWGASTVSYHIMYMIKILFKIHIINLTINALHFINSAGCVIDLSIHIYHSGALRRADTLRHICHSIPYYIIKILFKLYIINLTINALHFMNSAGCIIDLSIRIHCSGALRQAGTLRCVCHFIPYYIIKILFKIYIINLTINILLFANCTGCFVDLEMHIYYSGVYNIYFE